MVTINQHGLCITHRRIASEHRHAAVLQHSAVNAFQAVNFYALVGLPRGHVELRTRHVPPIRPCFGQLASKLGGIHHEFFGHAPTNHAGAAQAIALNQCHLGAVRSRSPSGRHAARAATNDDEIVRGIYGV